MLIPTGFKKLCRWRISELISGFSKTFFYILIYIFRDRTHVGKPKNTFPACFTIEYVLVNNQRTTQILSDLQADPTDRIRLRDASCDGVHIFHTHTHIPTTENLFVILWTLSAKNQMTRGVPSLLSLPCSRIRRNKRAVEIGVNSPPDCFAKCWGLGRMVKDLELPWF